MGKLSLEEWLVGWQVQRWHIGDPGKMNHVEGGDWRKARRGAPAGLLMGPGLQHS